MKTAIIILALLCAGCKSENATLNSNLVVYVDAETGCHYVRAQSWDGITPRMGADGKQICRKVAP